MLLFSDPYFAFGFVQLATNITESGVAKPLIVKKGEVLRGFRATSVPLLSSGSKQDCCKKGCKKGCKACEFALLAMKPILLYSTSNILAYG